MAFSFGSTNTPAFGSTPAKPAGFTGTQSFGQTGFFNNVFGQQQQPQQQPQQQQMAFGGTSFGATPSSAPPSFGATTFGATAASTAPSFGNTFAAPTASVAPTFASSFGAPQQQQAPSLFGAPASKPNLFGTTTTTASNLFSTPSSGATSLFGGTTTQAPNLFGGTASSAAPSLFGTTTTSTAPTLFGGGAFGQTTTSTTPSLFGGTAGTAAPFGSSLFGTTTTSTTPSLFGTNAFAPAATGTTGFGGFGVAGTGGAFGVGTGSAFGTTTGIGGFGAFGGATTQPTGFFGAKPAIGAPGQPQQPQTVQAKNQQVIASIYAITVYNDERDDILKKWNLLQACWGVGKGFYNASLAPVDYTPQNPFYRFKAMGYNIIPEHDNCEGIVRLIFNKKISEMRNQETVLKNGIGGILGNRPNLTIDVILIKATSESQTEVKICVSEKGVTGSSRKIPATDLAAFLNQPTQKQQLTNVGVTSITPYVTPSKAELEEYLKEPPPGIDLQMWHAAIQDNPNPKRYIPVPINGFSDLRARMLNQEYQTGLHQAFLEKVTKEITELKTKHSSSVAQINELKQKFMELQHRILRVLVRQECTRKVGIAIQPEEELLRGRLEVMHTQLNLPKQYKGQVIELLSYVKMMKTNQKQNAPSYKINGDALEETKQFLIMEQNGISELINVVNTDTKALKVISDGLKLAQQSTQRH